MSKSPSLTPKELIKLLEQKGFVFDRAKGSHQIYINAEKRLRIVVPMHNKDLATGLYMQFLSKQELIKMSCCEFEPKRQNDMQYKCCDATVLNRSSFVCNQKNIV